MKKEGYYSSGEFARMSHVTLRTIRYYDKHNILKPSFVTESGARFYTEQDFARLQQILLLKYLGFTLDDIKELTIADPDHHFLIDSLSMQLKLVQDKIEQMQSVEGAILDITKVLKSEGQVDWNQMLNLIHLTSMENTLKKQYQDASNISARINLHHLYASNKQRWFPWIYEQCDIKPGMKILEVGCGDGTLWADNYSQLPDEVEVTVSDISEGMLRDARRMIGNEDGRFRFDVLDCQDIPYKNDSFDLVIANHVLFYCEDIPGACQEIKRVLKPSGVFLCSTYGQNHMKEISQLVHKFDERIVLSAEKLYDKFGREDGGEMLQNHFSKCRWIQYEDYLTVTDHEPLISYILSCHGNQKQYILEHYKEFQAYVNKKTQKGFHITKDAGLFFCEK